MVFEDTKNQNNIAPTQYLKVLQLHTLPTSTLLLSNYGLQHILTLLLDSIIICFY